MALPYHLRVQSVVVTGTQMESMDEEDWEFVLTRRDVVFARTLPTQKQTIVDHLQQRCAP